MSENPELIGLQDQELLQVSLVPVNSKFFVKISD